MGTARDASQPRCAKHLYFAISLISRRFVHTEPGLTRSADADDGLCFAIGGVVSLFVSRTGRGANF